MALAESTVKAATGAVQGLGFFSEKDLIVGTRYSELSQRINFLSEDGLQFCKLNVLGDPRIRPVLASLLPSCGLARYRRFHSDPGHIFQFRRGGVSSRRVLVVMLWGSGSEVVYYGHSHRHALPGVWASNGLWEAPFAALERAGCSEGSSIHFEFGGLTLQDAGAAFEMRKGKPIATVFATHDVITDERWTKMKITKTPGISQVIEDIKRCTGIWLHAEVVEADTDERPLATTDPAAASSAVVLSSSSSRS